MFLKALEAIVKVHLYLKTKCKVEGVLGLRRILARKRNLKA